MSSAFRARQKKLFSLMAPDSVVLLVSGKEVHKSADAYYRFQPDQNFYYMTGCAEPSTIAIFSKCQKEGEKYSIFLEARDPAKEQWIGRRLGPEAAKEVLEADEAYVIEDFPKKFPELLQNREILYAHLGRFAFVDELVIQTFNQLKAKVRHGVRTPNQIIGLDAMISNLRLFKSSEEVALLQKAVDISVGGHLRAMRATRPGKFEYEIKAELVYEFLRHGCSGESYDSIVGSGENSCILHYIDTDRQLQNGDILLVDAGGCYQGYRADLTRTYPVNGKFSPEQKAIYEIVLAAQTAALLKVKPGLPWSAFSEAATMTITEGLVEIGLLSGKVQDLYETGAYKPFYMHLIGHWLGLDTHDVGPYKISEEWRNLEPHMVTTVEPGIYIKPGLTADPKWWGIGVRIEDNVLLTETGHRVLSQALPKTISDIEAIMNA